MDELMQCALESFPNFVVADAKGRIVYLNEGYARLLGTTPRAAIGRPVSEVIPNTRLNIVLEDGSGRNGVHHDPLRPCDRTRDHAGLQPHPGP